MTHDLNKLIENISYNHLNLPVLITFTGGNTIAYLYNAIGQKVRKRVTVDGNSLETYYLDGFQYSGGRLGFFPHAEGYVTATYCDQCDQQFQRKLSYVYNYTDHLGNIRLSYGYDPKAEQLKILEENHYYPFGLKHTNYSNYRKKYSLEEVLANEQNSNWQNLPSTQAKQTVLRIKQIVSGESVAYNYKFENKEWQDELGLNWYDFGGRLYDPATVRTTTHDPLAEKFFSISPQSFLNNNPLSFIDPTGMSSDDWRINYTDKNGQQQEFIFKGGATALPDNQFVRDFVSAYRYDVGNGGGDGLRSVAENHSLMIDVQETSAPSFTDQPSSSPGSGDYNVLNWNPKMGLETTNGTIMSPATVLDHEADHAGKYAAAGKASMNNRVETPDKKYDNKEEKRVITGSEQRTARANGEVPAGRVTRTDHKGLPVITTSPTSNKVDAAKTVKFNDKLNSQGLYPTPSADKYRKN